MAVRDKVLGAIICIIAVLIAIIYFYALFWGGYTLWAIEIVVSVGLLIVLGILFWVGYTIATTPSIEEIERISRKK